MSNKDFYNELPGMVCVLLDNIIEKYGDREGFDEAWENYRSHILSSSMDDMMMPQTFFKEVMTDGERKKNEN